MMLESDASTSKAVEIENHDDMLGSNTETTKNEISDTPKTVV